VELERAQRLVRLRCWGFCEGCGKGGLILSVHHRQARGSGGVHRVAAQVANDPRNLLALCGSCHDETEHAETWRLTEEIGWRIPKYVPDPFRVPALIHTTNGYGWWLFTQEGDYLWQDPHALPPLPAGEWRSLPEDPLVLAASPGSVSANRQRITYDTYS
jgi:hypothetical protein